VNQHNLKLELLPEPFAVAQLDREAAVPVWAQGSTFVSVTRTDRELSIVCTEDVVPTSVKAQRGFRCLRVVGPLDFAETGILESLAGPLAQAGISIFALSTYDTDYLFLSAVDLESGLGALSGAGHTVLQGRSEAK